MSAALQGARAAVERGRTRHGGGYRLAEVSSLGVWWADQLACDQARVQPTGYGALDALLPGGGWPVGRLTEVLMSPCSAAGWSLVLPALAAVMAQRGGAVVLVSPPFEPFVPVLQRWNIPVARVCMVRSAPGAARLWACEQALRCADVLAVLAWLPGIGASALRRLQGAAARRQPLFWVFNPLSCVSGASASASPAALRLQLLEPTGGQMPVQILKRRGPPVEQPLLLPAYGGCIQPWLLSHAAQRAGLWIGSAEQRVAEEHLDREGGHALDRIAVLAP